MRILNRNVWNVFGVPFDVLTQASAIEKIEHSVKLSKRLFLTTPNLNFVIASQSDPVFFQSILDSELIVADGMSIIWGAKLLGVPLTERVAGSDVFADLSKLKRRSNKISVFFFGGMEGTGEKASQHLNNRSDGMRCCGFYNPGFVSVKDMSTVAIIDKINVAQPDFLVISLGAKKGQEWIQKNREKLNVTIISHLGAVVDFVAGNIQRAPLFWQRSGFEWLWRIKQERSLWRRYFSDGQVFIKLLLIKALPLAIYNRRLRRSYVDQTPVCIEVNGNTIKLGASVHYAVLEPVKRCFDDMLIHSSGDIILDCADLDYIDSAFVGSLLLFQRYLNEQNRQLYLQHVSKRIFRLLDLNSVLKRFQINLD